jgi:site-specific DNA-methyltransferase (adenine-specific)
MKLINADCIQAMKEMAENSVDSIVTDPPYELGFMGKKWDSSGIAFNVEVWQQALRVLKPGGHLLAFSGSRTYHRMVVAIEDAGFEIRDQIMWIYGSGFPKSHNVANAIDKFHGASNRGKAISSGNKFHPTTGEARASGQLLPKYEARTEAGKDYEGWGTALKPAHEPIVVARKPLIGTVAENVLEHGVGGLNIDGCRIGTEKLGGGTMPNLRDVGAMSKEATGIDKLSFGQNPRPASRLKQEQYTGRWPANIIFDEQAAELLDEQSGISKDGVAVKRNRNTAEIESSYQGGWRKSNIDQGFSGLGGASRFFYVAKASKRDRNEGLEELLETTAADMVDREPDSAGMNSPRAGAGRTSGAKNFHPTVKPTSLMEYLIKLVTPPQGTVLDPFTGSGSTGKAAILQGFDFIGIEMTEEYLPIIEGRLKHAEAKVAERIKDTADQEQEKLF